MGLHDDASPDAEAYLFIYSFIYMVIFLVSPKKNRYYNNETRYFQQTYLLFRNTV